MGVALLDLNQIRAEYAQFLAADPQAKWRMDAALAHVVTLAYRRGLEDAKAMPPACVDLSAVDGSWERVSDGSKLDEVGARR